MTGYQHLLPLYHSIGLFLSACIILCSLSQMGDYNLSEDFDRLCPLEMPGIGPGIVSYSRCNTPVPLVPSKPLTNESNYLDLRGDNPADPSDNDSVDTNDQDTEDGSITSDTNYTDDEGNAKRSTDNNSENRDSDLHIGNDTSQNDDEAPVRVLWSLVQAPVRRRQLNDGRCARTTALRIAADAMYDRCAPVFANGENINRKLAGLEPFILLAIPMMMVQDLDLCERVKYQQIIAAIENLSYGLGAIKYGEDRVSDALMRFFRRTHLDEMFSYSFPLEWEALKADLHLPRADLLQKKMKCISLLGSPITLREYTPERRVPDDDREAPEAASPQVTGNDHGLSFVEEAASSPNTWPCLKRHDPFERLDGNPKKCKSVAGLLYRSGDSHIHCKPSLI
ncbi:hypothetical protein F5X99DRAFT_420606 [Biscogniauxia marginata]|nr:hypothetical protein F5X99DRAFT_420606 [Biscogniauxia marginata]